MLLRGTGGWSRGCHAGCAGRRLQSPHPAASEGFTGWDEQSQLWLQNSGSLGCFLLTCLSSHPCSVGVAGSEVSSGAGRCWGVFWAGQGTAVRFGKRNPTGFCKQLGSAARGSAQNSWDSVEGWFIPAGWSVLSRQR